MGMNKGVLFLRVYSAPHKINSVASLIPMSQWWIILVFYFTLLYFHDAAAPSRPRPPHYWGFMITLRHTTLSRTPLDEWSAWHSDLYLTTHNTHKRQTSMPPAGFEPTIPASEWPQTHALDSVATRTGHFTALYQPTLWILSKPIITISCFISITILTGAPRAVEEIVPISCWNGWI
jgi:hypothetical protein